MTRIGWATFAAGLLLSGATIAAPAGAAPLLPDFTGIYVFGDSLVDAGNARKAANTFDVFLPGIDDPAPPSQGYYQGRFANGYTYADRLSLDVTGKPSAAVFPYGFPLPLFGQIRFDKPKGNNLNFAYGGAQAIRGSEDVPGFRGQVDAYKALPGDADPNALYVVNFGGNDLFQAINKGYSAAKTSAYLDDVADRIAGQVARLEALGAQHFLVTGAPDIGAVPRYAGEAPELRAAATAASLQLDLLLRVAFADLMGRGDFTADLDFFSYLDFADEVSRLGFNLTTPCLAAVRPGPGIDCAGYAFFDDIHPTAEIHALIHDAMLGLLSPPDALRLAVVAQVPEPAAVGLLGIAVLGLGLRRARTSRWVGTDTSTGAPARRSAV